MADMNDRYKKAAALRLMTAMSPGPVAQQPAPGVPNYSAIPLDAPKPARPAMFGDGLANALEFMGFGNRPKPQGPAPSMEGSPVVPQQKPQPSPFPPYTGLRNEPGLPPFQQPGQQAAEYMPPISSKPMVSPQAANVYGGASAPAPAPMPAAPPQGADAAYVPPPTDNYADMGGYGGVPRMQSPQEQYGHLNPTPGLEEIFRREYAANPGAFGKLFG